MKPSRAANDNLIDRTLAVWKPRLERDLTREDAREIGRRVIAALEQFESAALGALTIVAIGLVPVLLLHQAVAGGRAGSGR